MKDMIFILYLFLKKKYISSTKSDENCTIFHDKEILRFQILKKFAACEELILAIFPFL